MAYNARPAPWTAEEDRQLRILWAAGWSTLAIGVTIGRGKNAICGRRKRLGLPERESPIQAGVCPDKVFRFRREVALAQEAAREELERLAA